jgi:hypothetical protein
LTEHSPSGNLTVPQLDKKFLAFYKTHRLISMFTRAHHL